MLSIFILLVLLSAGSVFAAVYFDRRYEEAVPLTIFFSVEIVFLFGLIDHLRWGFYAMCCACAVLYALSARRVFKQRDLKRVLGNLLTPACFIYILLLAVYAFCIVGRAAYRGDEFSFWATSVKKMWYLDMFHCVPAAEPYFAEYPPGMQIFQYILQAIKGEFSEWRISFAYMAYVFALFLPFLRGTRHREFFRNLLILAVIFTCGTIIYSEALDNLQVDFALGATFAYGMAWVCAPPTEDGRYDWFSVMHIVMAANMLVLIKSAGKLLAVIVLVALAVSVVCFYKKDLIAKIKAGKTAAVLAVAAGAVPFLTGMLWKAKYTYYQTHVAFDAGSYDLKEFFLILLGKADGGYRAGIKSSFVSFLISTKIQVGFLSLTNLQLALLLAVIFLLVWKGYQKNGRQSFHGCVFFVLFISMLVYWFGLLASYMYTFSEKEGVALASMQRYLNIYSAGILLTIIYLILADSGRKKWDSLTSCVILLTLLCFVSYPNVNDVLSRNAVRTSLAQRNSLQALADQITADSAGKKPEEKDTVLLIHKITYPHEPVNHFTYLLWPDYTVPWECSYGSHPVAEGDYTQIYTAEEFRDHVLDLSVDYIAIDLLDEDFVTTYASLFDTPLENGQVYRVDPRKEVFELLSA